MTAQTETALDLPQRLDHAAQLPGLPPAAMRMARAFAERLRRPVRICVLGMPGAGKSDLISAILDEGLDSVFARHAECAIRCRELGAEIGLETYPETEELCSPTVTAFAVEGSRAVQRELHDEHDILVGTGLADLEDAVLRIGHMGHNAQLERVEETMGALKSVLDGSDAER